MPSSELLRRVNDEDKNSTDNYDGKNMDTNGVNFLKEEGRTYEDLYGKKGEPKKTKYDLEREERERQQEYDRIYGSIYSGNQEHSNHIGIEYDEDGDYEDDIYLEE